MTMCAARSEQEPAERADPDLDTLLTHVAKGDQAAFEALYDQLAASAYGLIRKVLRDPSQAEEVTQEVLLEVWRTASRFDPARGSAAAWVLTIVEASMDAERLRRCLNGLSELQRESITLAYYGGYTYSQVAALLDTALGTIKTRIRDGLTRLRDCLGVSS
jgi:RNA polymerase sigma-70 factor, ECF subfamily